LLQARHFSEGHGFAAISDNLYSIRVLRALGNGF